MKRLLNYLPLNNDFGLLLLRIAAGGMMLFGHGWTKLMNFAEYSTQFPDPLGVGSSTSLGLTVFGEVFCSILIIFGLFTRVALIPLIIMGLVMVCVVHGADPFADKELALLYLVMYLVLFLTGPGKLSIDAKRGK